MNKLVLLLSMILSLESSALPQIAVPVSGTFANCISLKNPSGKPILDQEGFVICKKDSSGRLLGTSANGLEVIDSDAVQACGQAGGRLPSPHEFQSLMKAVEPGKWFWSSAVYLPRPSGAFCFLGNNGTLVHAYRHNLGSVICIQK